MPAPLQMPPMRTVFPPSLNSTAICFGFVSLVMMASTAFSGMCNVVAQKRGGFDDAVLHVRHRHRDANAARAADENVFGGHVKIFASRAVISSASFIPCLPVQALALPEFTTMAWAIPFFTRGMQTFTGAAQT